MLPRDMGDVRRSGTARAQNRPVTDAEDLEHTRNVERAAPPKLVEPPAPERHSSISRTDVPVVPEPSPVAEEPAAEKPVAPPEPPAGRRPYRLKMTDGVIVNLDLTVYLGRRPSVPRVASDRRVRLVAVPSKGKEVSATHLELRWTGDAVVATDMRSTNGSQVMVPGNQPRTLLRGESAVVTPGTLIDLGDGNVLEVLSPERLTVDS
jgi:hypothetical protein